MILQNERYKAIIENGFLTGFYAAEDGVNLADGKGKCGSACYTLTTDDITQLPHEAFTPYDDRFAVYTDVKQEDDATVKAIDPAHGIVTTYQLKESGLEITAETNDPAVSAFGIDLDGNFLAKKGSDYRSQLLPTSPYTSADGRYMYVIMTRPNGKFAVAVAKTPCDGWRIRYSPFCYGHYIFGFQFLASFDRAYHGSCRKRITIHWECADTLEEAFAAVCRLYGVPLVRLVLSGGFDHYAVVKTCGEADCLEIRSPSGCLTCQDTDGKIALKEYGFYTITPVKNGVAGLDATVWNGVNRMTLFDKSVQSIKKPYHPDDNLCEGGCFLWEMLLSMRLRKNQKCDAVVKEELAVIMGKTDPVKRRTIAPYPQNGYAPYHIYDSKRVQEQFFGVSILMEAYQVYKDQEILEHAVSALSELVAHFMKNGMVFNGADYTTVCCPMIPLVDMTLLLRTLGDSRAAKFESAATQMAAFLYQRGYNFPTEGAISEKTDVEREDGSISCTALALLYYCMHLHFEQRYTDFAHDILTLHRAWTMYTPDARLYGSSFRWWETIWEGDGQGPALCAGHAWTIWKAEALFYDGVLRRDDEALLFSANGFVSNFSKTQPDGTMYSCYEPDYIRGGGSPRTQRGLKQLSEKDIGVQYTVAHDYPAHPDHSLSRYAWVRAGATWLKTAALLLIDGKILPINATNVNGIWETDKEITQIYISDAIKDATLKDESLPRL